MSDGILEIRRGEIIITNYPFRPGRNTNPIKISSHEILEANLVACSVLLKNEIIYLPGWPREELEKFCESNSILTIYRYDVWSDILEPYVDTSYTDEEVEKRNNRLSAAGFNPTRVRIIRLFISVPMTLAQGLFGEWTGLYHYHLLDALRWLRYLGLYRLAYIWSMKVALDCYK